jgi:hypothetical protein
MRHALHYPGKDVGWKWVSARSTAILGAMAFASIAKGGEITSVKDTNSTTAAGVFQTREYMVTPTVDAARAASIAAANAWYQWDHGAAAERDAELARLREVMSAGGQTNVTQTRSLPE